MNGWKAVAAVAWLGVLLGAGGCARFGAFAHFHPVSSTMPAATDTLRDDDDHLDWAVDEAHMVVVRKSCRSLDVYEHGERVRSYPAVFGLNGKGSKLYEGDLRTPTGLYMIVDKRWHPRWSRFLLLDYPNLHDLHRYWVAMESGDIPQRGDRYAGVGGAVGIHGTDKPELNEKQVDWTFGCISLKSRDVEDLSRIVPIGTLVLIED
jgi:murein L,D-transpeptidase YafK